MGLVVLGSAVFAYSYWIEPRWIELTRVSVPIRGLGPAFDGYRIVQLSDLHLYPHTSADHVGRAVAIANRLQPDLIVLTGDYLTTAEFVGDEDIAARDLSPILRGATRQTMAFSRCWVITTGRLGGSPTFYGVWRRAVFMC